MTDLLDPVVLMSLDGVLTVKTTCFDTFLKNSREIKIVLRQKFHAVYFAYHHVIEAKSMCLRTCVEIVDMRHIDIILELEGCDAQLDDAEVEGGFLDALIKL